MMIEPYIDYDARNKAEKANERLKKLINTIVKNNNDLLSIIDETPEERLLPSKFTLSKRTEKINDITKKYEEFLKADNKFPVFNLINGFSVLFYKDLDKLKFNAGEKCCDLIVSCLNYLQCNFSKDERNNLFKFVNNKNKEQ